MSEEKITEMKTTASSEAAKTSDYPKETELFLQSGETRYIASALEGDDGALLILLDLIAKRARGYAAYRTVADYWGELALHRGAPEACARYGMILKEFPSEREKLLQCFTVAQGSKIPVIAEQAKVLCKSFSYGGASAPATPAVPVAPVASTAPVERDNARPEREQPTQTVRKDSATPSATFQTNPSGTQIIRYLGGGGDVVIPAKIKKILENAFSDTDVTSVSFEKGSMLQRLGDNSFENCHSLRSVDFSNTENVIVQYGVFRNCENLKEIIACHKISYAREGAFEGDISLFYEEEGLFYPRMWLYNALTHSESTSAFSLQRKEPDYRSVPMVWLYNKYCDDTNNYFVQATDIPVAANAGYGSTVLSCEFANPATVKYEEDEDEADSRQDADLKDITATVWTEFDLPTRESVLTFLDGMGLNPTGAEGFTDEAQYRSMQRDSLLKFKDRCNAIRAQRGREGKPEVLDYDLSQELSPSTQKSVEVQFLNGIIYAYNSEFDVKSGDLVYVEGTEEGRLGIVVKDLGAWNRESYMKKVTKAYRTAWKETERFPYATKNLSVEEIVHGEPDPRVRQKHVRIRVKFPDGKSYSYNCGYDVRANDQVLVEGKMDGVIGVVVTVEGGWKRSAYMQKVKKVIPVD